MSPFWGAFLGAFLALCANTMLRWWQYRRDLWMKHGEQFCNSVDAFGTLAAEYWLTAGGRKSAATEPSLLAAKEFRLLALQTKVDMAWEIARGRLGAGPQSDIERDLDRLAKAATGGDFQVRGRAASAENARVALTTAADVTVGFWSATVSAVSLTGTMAFVLSARSARGILLLVLGLVAGFLIAAVFLPASRPSMNNAAQLPSSPVSQTEPAKPLVAPPPSTP